MKYRMAALLIAALSAASLAACSEKPQRLVSDGESTLSSESWQGQFRERTLKQGESGRMDY